MKLSETNKIKLLYIAGATDLMVNGSADRDTTAGLIDLTGISEITETIKHDGSGILIGAAVPLSRIYQHPEIIRHFRLLCEACCQIGSVQVQNRATLGGNIANASPAGDTLPVLCAYNADIQIGPPVQGDFEKIKLDRLMEAPGKTSLDDNRYIAFIYLPLPEYPEMFAYFRKVGPRHAMAISKVSLALVCHCEKNIVKQISISTGSVSPRITRAARSEEFLLGKELSEKNIQQAKNIIQTEIDPIDDIRSTSEYRRTTCANLLGEALSRAARQ